MSSFNVDDIPYLCPIDEKWEHRPNSNIVDFLMKTAQITGKEAGEIIGCSKQYFENKKNRNSFSFEDLVILSEACGYSICFMDRKGGKHFRPTVSPKVIDRVESLNKKHRNSKMQEYEKFLHTLEKLKEELGIEKGDLS